VEGSRTVNVGTLREAVNYFRSLSFIRSLQYVEKLSVDIPSLEVKEHLDVQELKVLGLSSKRRFESKLPKSDLDAAEVQAYLKAFDL